MIWFGSYADVHYSKKPYGNEDISDFVHGKSKYIKGKGQHIKLQKQIYLPMVWIIIKLLKII